MAIDLNEAKQKMTAALEHLHGELKKIRTGRANPAMLDGIMVSAYGQPMPLKHVANVVAADAQLLSVTPFDPNNLGAISAAISESSLELNPSDDGHVVRVPVPPLSEERRQELVKQIHATAEDTRVALRNIRHEVLNTAKDQKKGGDISENDQQRLEKQVSELMEDFQRQIETALKQKEAEIMKV
jgi:ribosome recycling factor